MIIQIGLFAIYLTCDKMRKIIYASDEYLLISTIIEMLFSFLLLATTVYVIMFGFNKSVILSYLVIIGFVAIYFISDKLEKKGLLGKVKKQRNIIEKINNRF